MEWTPEELKKIATEISAASAGGIIAWRKIRKVIFRLQQMVAAADNLNEAFGEDAGNEILDRIGKLEQANLTQEFFHNIMAARLKVGLYVCDQTARCTYANPVLSELFDMDRAQMLGWGWLGGIHKDDANRTRMNWMEAVKERLPYRESYKLRNGTICETEAFLISQLGLYVGYVTPASAAPRKNEKPNPETTPR